MTNQHAQAKSEKDTIKYTPGRTNFGPLPEPEKSLSSFITSIVINGLIVVAVLLIGARARQVLVEHRFEQTVLIIPTAAPPPEKIKLPEPPKIKMPEIKAPEIRLDAARIKMPKPEPKPELKPLQMEAKLALPVTKAAKLSVILAPQPKAALTAAMPAQSADVKASTKPVHFGETFGVTPNPNAKGPATIAAIGNPYGGVQGPAVAPHGVVGSAGIGNGLRSGSNSGVVGKVASAGIPGTATSSNSNYAGARVASAGIPKIAVAAPVQQAVAAPVSTSLEVISKPPVQYTAEARQLKIQGDVVLRVTFTASGQVQVQGVLHGLAHGLDEEARRVAQQIRFRPATRNGQAVDLTTNITISFQLA